MPKKTRQAKMAATLRRLQSQQTETTSPPTEKPGPVNLQNIVSSEPIKSPAVDYSYVYHDLRKTTIFSVVAVIFEIALSVVISYYGFKFW
jgi:hypothetical protein